MDFVRGLHSGRILTNTVKTKPGHYDVQQLQSMLLAILV